MWRALYTAAAAAILAWCAAAALPQYPTAARVLVSVAGAGVGIGLVLRFVERPRQVVVHHDDRESWPPVVH